MIDLSVIVMGYRDAHTIVDSVASVLGQADERVEVVVVTSGNDRSGGLVRERFPQLTVIESRSRLLPGGARNAGVRASRGAAVAFLAADCSAEPGWVAERRAAHRAGHAAVASSVVPAPPASLAAWAGHLLLYPGRLPSRAAGVVRYPDDGAHGLSLDRDLLDAVGEYDERVRVGEDTKLAMALEQRRLAIWFAPAVCTAQRGPTTIRELLADQFARGRRHARFDPGTAMPSRAPRLLSPVVEGVAFVVGAVARAWRTAPGQRPVLVRAVPLMIAGGLARQLGRARAGSSRRSPS